MPRRRLSGCFISCLFPARVLLSPAQPGRSCRSDFSQHLSTEARAASHARDKHLSRSRAVFRKSVTGAVRLWGGTATALRDGPGEESDRKCSGKFLEKWNLAASSRLHGAYLVYRNYFSLFCFSFHSGKAAPTRPDQPPVFRPAILH